MAKSRSTYICSNCGKRSPQQFKLCPQCRQFDTMEEHKEQVRGAAARHKVSAASRGSAAVTLAEIDTGHDIRIPVPAAEFNRVLGGGLVPGSLILLGGEPGIGKSTLVLELSALLAQGNSGVLYVSGEESARQIKLRADRLGLSAPELYLLAETDLDFIIDQAKSLDPILVVIDSIQTTRDADLEAAPGLIAQVRHCAAKLQELAKSSGISILMIGHVTKDGNIAGPRVLEHIVDAVLTLEGDPFQYYRLLRSVKNRFGATSEVGVFEMRGSGLVQVENPSEAFLEERLINAAGSAIAITMEGSRPLLLELQALTSPSAFGNPRRTANGVDLNRLLLISAVLSKRIGLKLWEQDIFVNVIGGMRVSEPASDLAMAMAIASSYSDRPLPADLAIVGEVGLSGEVRRAGQLAARLNEALKIGFKRALVPKLRRRDDDLPAGIQLIEARSVAEALRAVLPTDSFTRGSS
ncbi:MAG: DNA repair protein RadA [Chloroflexi bacterium]|nr:DNA repair protein RadA [Chloroflexota bacterium]